MSGFELFLVFLTLNGHPASKRLLRVLQVRGETSERLVVASLGWLRRPEGPLVFSDVRRSWLRRPMRQQWVFFKNLSVRVEVAFSGGLGPLREILFLKHGLVIRTFSIRKDLGPVVVILDVGDRAAKGDPLAGLAFLRWVCQDIAGRDHNLSRVLWILIVFLNLDEVGHVHVS